MSSSIGNSQNTLTAELLLNKIMNGKLSTESGKTITMGTRAQSSELNQAAIEPSITSANIKAKMTIAIEVQNFLTEAKDYLENLDKEMRSATVETANALKTEAAPHIRSLHLKSFDGQTIFTDDVPVRKIDIDIGLGDTISIGGIDLETVLDELINTKTGLKATVTDANLATFKKDVGKLTDDALDVINGAIATTSSQIRVMNGRTAILDDLASTYVDAAANQSIVGTGSASGLLNNVLN